MIGEIMSLYCLCVVGFVVDYISHPVINSFTTAAAITIAASQLKVSQRHFIKMIMWLLVDTVLSSLREIKTINVFDNDSVTSSTTKAKCSREKQQLQEVVSADTDMTCCSKPFQLQAVATIQ